MSSNGFMDEIVRMRGQIMAATAIPEWIMRGYRSRLECAMTEIALTDEESKERYTKHVAGLPLGVDYFAAIVDEANFLSYAKRAADSSFIVTARSKQDLRRHVSLLGKLDDDGTGDSGEDLPEKDPSTGVH
jgi:hypothetical protein